MLKKIPCPRPDARLLGCMELRCPARGIHLPPLITACDMIIRPNGGLGTRPCKGRTLLYYIADGILTHGDSLNHHEHLHAGQAFVLSSGSGMRHSELNCHNQPLHLVQLSFNGNPHSAPQYAKSDLFRESCRNRRVQIACPARSHDETALCLGSDAFVFTCLLCAGETSGCPLEMHRMGFLLILSGSGEANGIVLRAGDSLFFTEESLVVTAFSDFHMLLVSLPF